MFVNQGNRPTNVYDYPCIYLKRCKGEQENGDKPRRLRNERNSYKVSVKDLKNKMKAIPKTSGCKNQHFFFHWI